MTPVLRISLIIGAAIVLVFVIRKIKHAQFNTEDSLFWLLLISGLVICALFPGIPYFLSELLGIQSPSNFIFLAVISLLLIREFRIQAEVAKLRQNTTELAQEFALHKSEK